MTERRMRGTVLLASPGDRAIEVVSRMTSLPCTAHAYHTPRPTYCELHHVIPQAWQAVWSPDGRPALVPDHDHPDPRAVSLTLWDPRTVALCPTGHRNVHYWLVRLMKAIEPSRLGDTGVVAALADARTILAHDASRMRIRPRAAEIGIASQAIIRVAEAAGDSVKAREAIALLIQRKQWGEA